MENLDDSKQKNEQDQSKVMNTTNNAISEKDSNNTSPTRKSRISAKVLIIIGIAIALIIALVLILIIVFSKKKDKKKPFIGENLAEPTNIYNDTGIISNDTSEVKESDTSEVKESTETANIYNNTEIITFDTSEIVETTIISNDTEIITIETTEVKETTIDSNDLEGITLDYASAEKIIDSETTKENHNILNESLNNIDELMFMYNNINFSTINATVNENP